ncbi:MAG: hypothetical protein GTO04_04840, partial [Planctomycetales bacterium]|nr:hypothetical protein [Planctomycetales bacterium]
DGQPNATATGDDDNPGAGPNDEDGVTFSGTLNAGDSYDVQVQVSNDSALLSAWVDFNADGD